MLKTEMEERLNYERPERTDNDDDRMAINPSVPKADKAAWTFRLLGSQIYFAPLEINKQQKDSLDIDHINISMYVKGVTLQINIE